MLPNASDDFKRKNPEMFGDTRPQKAKTQKRGANKTEQEYYQRYLLPRGVDKIRHEACTFPLACGRLYTPDWIVWTQDGIECHEVKGPHVHNRGSGEKFDQAKHEYLNIRWIWAQKTKDGWKIKE